MEITEIKEKLTLAEVIKHYGLKADKQNRICCPFHDDTTPSMQLYYKTHTAYCFSSNCKTHGRSMDVIDFIMHKEGYTKAEAIKKAVAMVCGESEIKQAPTMNQSREVILQNMFTYFKNAVHNSKPAQEYIRQRGLDPTKLEIGYNTAQFHHGTRRDETLINNCVAVGLLAPWGTNNKNPDLQAYRPFAKYCICFALKDRAGHITGLYFRSTENNSDQKHFYLKESKGLYPKYPSSDTEKLIITESVIDAASLLQIEAIAKEYSILAAYGTNRLNDEMKGAILELKQLKEIAFAFDNDEPGNKAIEKYSKELKELLPEVTFSKIDLPCKDVNETLVAHHPDIFLHLLEGRAFINFPVEGFSEEPGSGKGTFLFSNESESPIKSDEKKKEIETKVNQTEEGKLNTTNPNKIIFATETATYYILGGLPKALDNLKIMLSVENSRGFKSRNRVDLYEDKQVERLCKEISEKLNIRKDLLEADIYKLTELVEQHRENEQVENKVTGQIEQTPHFFTLKERVELETFLKRPRVIKDLMNC